MELFEAIGKLEVIAFKLRALQGIYESLEQRLEDSQKQEVDVINALWYMNESLSREIEGLEKQTEAIYDAYYATEKEEERETA